MQRLLRHVRFVLPAQPVDATLYLKEKRWSVTMDQGFRRGFTAAEKTELWDRWQRGESLKAIVGGNMMTSRRFICPPADTSCAGEAAAFDTFS
jgi:hypothetical protein